MFSFYFLFGNFSLTCMIKFNILMNWYPHSKIWKALNKTLDKALIKIFTRCQHLESTKKILKGTVKYLDISKFMDCCHHLFFIRHTFNLENYWLEYKLVKENIITKLNFSQLFWQLWISDVSYVRQIIIAKPAFRPVSMTSTNMEITRKMG